LLRLGKDRIRQAAFLDERALAGDEPGAWLPLAALLESGYRNAGPQGVILHCGHCGSTLITRLLGELPGVRVLREPLALQALAMEARLGGTPHARLTADEFDRMLTLTQSAYAKAPADVTSVIVKHTSFTANLAVTLLNGARPPAFLCLWIPLPEYLAIMLREESLREGIRQLASQWIYDLERELGAAAPLLAELSDAELAALNWTAAQLAFARASIQPGARMLAWEFADFLAEPAARLGELAHHFEPDVNEREVNDALASTWMRRYAKDPRYPFDAGTRARELAAASRRFAEEIPIGTDFARNLWDRLALAGAPAAKP
ncbi:MAG: hypothetical protein ACRD3Y_07270, partial [Bryobacteraceae bacterium]